MLNTIRVCLGTNRNVIELDLYKQILDNTTSKVKFCGSYLEHIPKLFDFEGYAIYLASHIKFNKDIQDLWEIDLMYPNNNAAIWCPKINDEWNLNVCFLNLKEFRNTPQEFLVYQQISDSWNS